MIRTLILLGAAAVLLTGCDGPTRIASDEVVDTTLPAQAAAVAMTAPDTTENTAATVDTTAPAATVPAPAADAPAADATTDTSATNTTSTDSTTPAQTQ